LNDFYPFNRSELKAAEPELFEKMGRWGSLDSTGRSVVSGAVPPGGSR
jgi:hypothetical protein